MTQQEFDNLQVGDLVLYGKLEGYHCFEIISGERFRREASLHHSKKYWCYPTVFGGGDRDTWVGNICERDLFYIKLIA